MSPEQYWQGDCHLAKSYRELHELKKEEKNRDMWFQGLYFYDGVSTVHHNLNRKKGQKPINYPDKPYDISPKKIDPEAERKKAIESFNRQFKMWEKYKGKNK